MHEGEPKLSETILKRGNMFELVHIEQPDGRIFEVARRAPGVRLVIADHPNRKLLLSKEFRRELNDWDYRLPGGKVFDSLEEYDKFRKLGGDITQAAASKGKAEGHEEVGIEINGLKLIKKSTLGATVEWDLFVFEATDWQAHPAGQKLEAGEEIEADKWFSYDEAEQMVMDGKMQEERIALILLQWLHKQ